MGNRSCHGSDGQSDARALECLRRLGWALGKGRWVDCPEHDDGQADAILEFPSRVERGLAKNQVIAVCQMISSDTNSKARKRDQQKR
jgi:hypothetical protein